MNDRQLTRKLVLAVLIKLLLLLGLWWLFVRPALRDVSAESVADTLVTRPLQQPKTGASGHGH